MQVNGQPQRTIWFDEAQHCVRIIDQTLLPHHFNILSLHTLDSACHAIISMQVRGAPLIGVTAAFGVYLALREGNTDLVGICERLLKTRPTAVNLRWALERVQAELLPLPAERRSAAALSLACVMADEDAAATAAP